MQKWRYSVSAGVWQGLCSLHGWETGRLETVGCAGVVANLKSVSLVVTRCGMPLWRKRVESLFVTWRSVVSKGSVGAVGLFVE